MEVAIEDFFVRLYLLCTLFDRARLLRFAFKQLQDVDSVARYGDTVHKKHLVAMVAILVKIGSAMLIRFAVLTVSLVIAWGRKWSKGTRRDAFQRHLR